MPRQFGKVDDSAGWKPCEHCQRRHVLGSLCPPRGVWIVLVLCTRCKLPDSYCGRHAARRPLVSVPAEVPLILPDESGPDVQERRAGDG